MKPGTKSRIIVIQGNLIIEDPDEEVAVPGSKLTQQNRPISLVQISSTTTTQQMVNNLDNMQKAYKESGDWVLVSRDDFNTQADIKGWSYTQTSYCTNAQDSFLGGHCLLGGGQEVYKILENLPTHSRILVLAVIHQIDNWQGESAQCSIDNEVKWERVGVSMESAPNLCGGPYKEAAYNVPVIIDTMHNRASIKISFGTTIAATESPCDKSLGIDNVEIYIK